MLEIEEGSFVVSWGWHALFLAYFLFWNFCYSLQAVVVAGFSGLWIHLALDSPIVLNLDCIILWSYLSPQGILLKITSAFAKDFREGLAPSQAPKDFLLGFLSTLDETPTLLEQDLSIDPQVLQSTSSVCFVVFITYFCWSTKESTKWIVFFNLLSVLRILWLRHQVFIIWVGCLPQT